MNKTGINFERCNILTAEKHNSRDPQYMEAINSSPNRKYEIFCDESKNNLSWINPQYQDKSLSELYAELRGLYIEKTGKSPQERDRVREITDRKTGLKRTVTNAGWSPIREGVCPVKADTTIDDFAPFIAWLKTNGITVVRIDIHHDEGHIDLLTGERKHNHHSHVICDWVDHETGKTAKLHKADASQMQTQIALSLGMERGISKAVTGKDHLSPDRQRAKAIAEDIVRLEEQLTTLKEEYRIQLVRICNDLQHIGCETVLQFDETVSFLQEILPVTEEERDARDALESESLKDIYKLMQKELLWEQSVLHNLIESVMSSIRRMSGRIKESAANIPKLSLYPGRQRKLLEHEAKLLAQMDKNIEEAAAEKNLAARIMHDAQNAKINAEKAEKDARLREKQAQEQLRSIEEKIAKREFAGWDRGVKVVYESWESEYETVYKPIEEERNKLVQDVKCIKGELFQEKEELRRARLEIKEQSDRFFAIANVLVRFKDSSVAIFERAGLREIIGGQVWDVAKEKVAFDKSQEVEGTGIVRSR